MPIHLVQLQKDSQRRVAIVEEPRLHLLSFASTYDLINTALDRETTMLDLLASSRTGETLDYDPIYAGKSDWQLLAPLDHPTEPARCLVTGTGLTHMGSAKSRNAMHSASASTAPAETDSMKMFRWGVEGGRPAAGQIGNAPEWFYKGPGTVLRAHNQPLDVPPHAEDGGEEAEIVGLYIITPCGSKPLRIGMAQGNEFSDHVFEKKNYLNLAGSKLRTCSIGPELVLNPDFKNVTGTATIERAGKILWSKPIATGEEQMCHSLANIEHHHFKFEAHRRPCDVHVHYFGADALSFGEGIHLQDGDIMQVQFQNFGRPLRNSLRVVKAENQLITSLSLK